MALADLLRRASTEPGSNRDASGTSNSLSSLLATLIPTALLAFVFVLAFFFFRGKYKKVYAPRTYIDSLGDQRRTPPQSAGFFGWVKDFRSISDRHILDHQSIDAYLFVRFFKLMVVISFLGCCITWPVLLPINITGHGNLSQLDMLSMANVVDYKRYYAHAIVSCIFLGSVMIIIARESFFTVNMRQAYRRSPWGASRLSSRTILFTNVPKALTEAALFEMFPGVQHAWVASNCKELDKMIKDRDDVAMKLEAAEVQLSRDANINRTKVANGKKGYQGEDSADGFKWLNPEERPTHKLKFLIGKKVDTIEYGRQHLAEVIPKIQVEQDKHWNGQGDLVGAVFLQFDTQRSAQDAWQMMQKKKTKPNSKMAARQLGVHPQEVVWNNLRISKIEHLGRWVIGTAFITAMIVFWAIPVAFVGMVSHIDKLVSLAPFLSFIEKIPSALLGIITGLLPAVALAILMSLVPIICRLVAKLAGYVTYSQIELQTQSWYFAFQVVQVFLITTFAGAATTVISAIKDDPSSALTLLSQNLPLASNVYISYFIVFGLSAAASTLLNIGGLVGFVLLGKILPGKTPRKIFQKLTTLAGPKWGSEFPKWVNLGVIALSYSCIAPIILGFCAVGLSLIYIAFRYNFLYTYEANIDTKGGAYQRALSQIITGVYLSELCLIGLFSIASGKSRSALGPLIIEAVLFGCTILFHIMLRKAIVSHEARIAYADAVATPYHTQLENGHGDVDGAGLPAEKGHGRSPVAEPKPSKIPGFIQRIINPESSSTATLSGQLDQYYHKPQEPLPTDIAKRAYFNPSVTSPTPVLWIVRDDMGISARELTNTTKAVPGLIMTDEQATFNEKNKVEWSGFENGNAREAPIYEEKILY